MSANTILLDFSVDTDVVTAKGFDTIERDVVTLVESQLNGDSLKRLTSSEIASGGLLAVYTGPRGSVISIRLYPVGLVTINIDYYLEEDQEPLLSLEECRVLERSWGSRNKPKKVKTLPILRRGIPFDTYFLSSDERLLEYDIDNIVFDENSPYQHIQIVHSGNFGNLLILDDLQNLAESDLVYTESIMCRGVEDYTGKEILILGGGDGALLHELRKENAKFITMVEIDKMVMDACKIYLRSACGDTLDNYDGDNYKIIVGDCVDFMQKCVDQARKFDYVFADLTDIPISQTPQGEIWEFIKQILDLSFRVLKDTGKYMTHGNGTSSPKALKMFEDVVTTLSTPVSFSRTHAFVPSFMEDWVFYQIFKKL